MVRRPPPQNFTTAPRGEAFEPEPPPFIERPSMRESVEDSYARAAKRTAELRGHFVGGVLNDGVDEFYIDPSVIPPGWTYEWKLFSVLGKEESSYQVMLANTGWEPVPTSRHPEFMPRGCKDLTIMRRGMQLMERPAEITAEARQIERDRARYQVRIKEQQVAAAPPGQFGRDNSGAPLAKIGKSYEAMPVPK